MDYDAYFPEIDGKRLAEHTLLPSGIHVLCHNHMHPPKGRNPRLPDIGFPKIEDAVAYAETLPGHVRVYHETVTVTECVRDAICTCRCIRLVFAKG